jgi:hypothetical protein
MAQQISTNTFGVAKWVVSADATQGTHTTITGAVASASSGDTIFIRDGNYAESFTIPNGINLVGESINNSIITGKVTVTAGVIHLQNLTINSVSDFAFVQSGASESQVTIRGCYLNASANTNISVTTSNASSLTTISNCIYTTGVSNSLFTFSSSGTITVDNLQAVQAVQTTTNNSITTSGTRFVRISNSYMTEGLTCSGGTVNIFNSLIDQQSKNATSLTVSGATFTSRNNVYISGSASAMSCSSGTLNSYNDTVGSSNTNAVTGAGTINYSGMIFSNTSSLINTTTQSGGIAQGLQNGVAPAAGFIGELITATATTGTLTSNTVTNITNINLTAGIWDISSYCRFKTTGTVAGNTEWDGAISLANNNLTGVGENGSTETGGQIPVNGTNDVGVWTGPTRSSISTTTQHYLNCRGVGSVTFTNVTCTGVIRAVRVA